MLSRRDFCIDGLGLALVSFSCRANDDSRSAYRSTLVNGYTPAILNWAGRSWRCNMGSTWHPDMDYCLRLARSEARCEIRNTPYDHSRVDEATKRRAEISGSLPGDRSRLP